jgi:hypothetical protein
MKPFFLTLIAAAAMSFQLGAQQFAQEMPIAGITKDSLYKIPLNPEHKQYMKSDFHDMRVYDNKGHEVPYVVLSEPQLKAKSDFVEYKILSLRHVSDYTEVVVHNPDRQKISNIAFNINNSDAYKYCSIEGSYDMNQWYSVSAGQELSLLYNEVYTNQYKCIYFPLNDYPYFRLSIDDWHHRHWHHNWESYPFKINSAGYFKNSVIAGKLNDVLFSKTITEDAKTKTTTVRLLFTNNQQVDRLDFKIKAPRLYKRHATIYVNRKQYGKGPKQTIRENLFEMELSSDKVLMFDLPNFNEQELFIEIDNKDNPPLEIESINCMQLASYLIADFKGNTTYTLKCGNDSLKVPEYDLGSFVSQIPQLLPEAQLGTVKILPKEAPKPKQKEVEKEKTFFETPQFLWLCLGVGCIVIFLFSRSLLKEVGKKE